MFGPGDRLIEGYGDPLKDEDVEGRFGEGKRPIRSGEGGVWQGEGKFWSYKYHFDCLPGNETPIFYFYAPMRKAVLGVLSLPRAFGGPEILEGKSAEKFCWPPGIYKGPIFC